MSDECIHGLEGGLCASCFPKAAPDIAPGVATRGSRSKSAGRAPSLRSSPSPLTVTLGGPNPTLGARTATAKPITEAKATGTVKPVRSTRTAHDNVGEQRIYHVTHIRNLAGILNSGRLLADASDAWIARPIVDLSSAPQRAARRAALVAGDDSASVASYVPFFLSPNARLWDSLLTASNDPRLSPEAHSSETYDFVFLVSTVKKLHDARTGADDNAAAAVAVTNGDAAGALTRFGAAPETADRMLRSLRADVESQKIREAELLVTEQFPFELVTLVGVANDKVRDAVRAILATGAHKPKVVVYPPWFHAVEDTAAL
ncbi:MULTISPECIES: DarT ssDNA thymidine ADP-ribosyltransferase family protein [Cryobacterium]|uniref:DarT ssDNA thymidine ADP-ribosyltransferase family protein n=1 Tax=Cryobacterium TaxID=69578 RepID=UPI00141B220A|nr:MULTISPECIES: DarT ssDNA thymidine ADP-ribosyltransferase family protein [Cryobacterium]